MKKYAVIVAGGRGLRMGGELPKQFRLLQGRPLLMYTIERFYRCDAGIELLLVLPDRQTDHWIELCRSYRFEVPCRLVAGGTERFFSVKNALDSLPDGEEALVAVHDGVRPFVSDKVICRCYAGAALYGTAVPVTEVTDTLRLISEEGIGSRTVERKYYRLVQTPQVFRLSLLKRAYMQPYETCFTDDASVVEALGETLFLTDGERENIKITTPFDWEVAKTLL